MIQNKREVVLIVLTIGWMWNSIWRLLLSTCWTKARNSIHVNLLREQSYSTVYRTRDTELRFNWSLYCHKCPTSCVALHGARLRLVVVMILVVLASPGLSTENQFPATGLPSPAISIKYVMSNPDLAATETGNTFLKHCGKMYFRGCSKSRNT